MLVDRLPVKQYTPWLVMTAGSEVMAVQLVVSAWAGEKTDNPYMRMPSKGIPETVRR